MAIDYPPQTYARAAVVARVKAAFEEGSYLSPWEDSESRRLLDEPNKSDAMTEQIAKLTALADTMRKGLHGNAVDVPVSPKLDEWIDELDRIIAGMQPRKEGEP